jgi:hypothetical protein
MARDRLDHIRLTRLETASVSKPRKNFGSRTPLRTDPPAHGARLLDEASAAVAGTRRPPGVSPDRLMVLRMRFLDDAQRELLGRFGIVVVDEREDRQAVDPPYYESLVEFDQA